MGLAGASIMVVEDDFLIGLQLQTILEEAGATVIGPLRSVRDALQSVRRAEPGAAILDIRLDNETVGPLAEELARRGIPFAFYTGQLATDPIRAKWPGSPILGKPEQPEVIVQAMATLLHSRDRQPAVSAG